MLSKKLISKIGVLASVTSIINSGAVFADENSTVQIVSEIKKQNNDTKINDDVKVTTPSAVTLKSIDNQTKVCTPVLLLDDNIFEGNTWEYGYGKSDYVLELSTGFVGVGEGTIIFYRINNDGGRTEIYRETTTSGITHCQLGNLSVGDYKYIAEFVSNDENKWKSCESEEIEFKVSKKNLNIKPKEQVIKAGENLPNIEFEYKGLYPGCEENGIKYPADEGSVVSGLEAKYVKEDGSELTDTSVPGKYKIKIINSGEAENYNITANDGDLYINSASASQTQLTLINDAKNINISDRIDVNIPDSILHPENMEGVLYGTDITFTANVKAQNGNIPNGKVVFYNIRDNKWEKLGEKQVDNTGKAVFTTNEINVFDESDKDDIADYWLKGKEKKIRAVFEPLNNEEFTTSSDENKIRLQKAILFIDTKVSNTNPKPGETIDITLAVKNLDNPECKKGFPTATGKEDVLQMVVYPNGAGVMNFNVIQDKNNPEIYRGQYTIPDYDFYKNNGDMMTNFKIYGGLNGSKCLNYTSNAGINSEPDIVEKVIVNLDKEGEDITDNNEEEFKDAKAKALEFISKYKFTKNMDWRDFTNALTKELSSLGVTNTGDEATINQNTGEVTATIYLYKGSKVYSFPIKAQAVEDDNTSNELEEEFKDAKAKALEFISKYKFTKNMDWKDFTDALTKELSSLGITNTGDEATINQNTGEVTATIYLYKGSKVYSFPIQAQAINSSSTSSSSSSSHKHSSSSSSGSSSSNDSNDNESSSVSDKNETDEKNNEAVNINNISQENKPKWEKNNDGTYSLIVNEQKATGWQSVDNKWYFMDSLGIMQTGWLKDKDAKWYYLNSNGEMKKGWIFDNGKWYHLKESGEMQTGWFKENGRWYYLKDTGEMALGWIQDKDGKWYYLKADGSMAYYTYINGYYVGGDGAWIK